MSKSILISIQPKWCELIASGKKTVEVRKTRPKLDTPFKVYIYCTLQGSNKFFKENCNGDIAEWNRSKMAFKKGKVIGEFMCDGIKEYESEFVDNDCLETIASIDREEDGDVTGFYEWRNDDDVPYINTDFFRHCCVGYVDLKKYMGTGFGTFYGWHISNLVIYEKPKELSEFKSASTYGRELRTKFFGKDPCCVNDYKLTRPPQSWCYVE